MDRPSQADATQGPPSGSSTPERDQDAATTGDASEAREPNQLDVDLVGASLASGKELEHSEPEPSGAVPVSAVPSDVPGLKFLNSLMKATPFTDLFRYHADLRYLHTTPQERFIAHSDDRPKFYALCRNCDWIARAGILALVVFVVGAAAVGMVLGTFYDWVPSLIEQMTQAP